VLNLFDSERGEQEGFVTRRGKLHSSDLIHVPVPDNSSATNSSDDGVLQQTAPKWRCLHDTAAGELQDESREVLHLGRLHAIDTKESRSIIRLS
jgi:hypothetical protein